MSLSVLGGLGWQNTQYSPSAVPETPQDILALVIAGGLQMQSFSKTNLDITVSVLPALSDPGRFFFNTNATYYLKLWSNLTLNLSFYGSWDYRTAGVLLRQRLRFQFRARLELRQQLDADALGVSTLFRQEQ